MAERPTLLSDIGIQIRQIDLARQDMRQAGVQFDEVRREVDTTLTSARYEYQSKQTLVKDARAEALETVHEVYATHPAATPGNYLHDVMRVEGVPGVRARHVADKLEALQRFDAKDDRPIAVIGSIGIKPWLVDSEPVSDENIHRLCRTDDTAVSFGLLNGAVELRAPRSLRGHDPMWSGEINKNVAVMVPMRQVSGNIDAGYVASLLPDPKFSGLIEDEEAHDEYRTPLLQDVTDIRIVDSAADFEVEVAAARAKDPATLSEGDRQTLLRRQMPFGGDKPPTRLGIPLMIAHGQSAVTAVFQKLYNHPNIDQTIIGSNGKIRLLDQAVELGLDPVAVTEPLPVAR
jgi:hypothetical protein